MVTVEKKIDIPEELRRAFLVGEGQDVSVGDIVQALGPRSFGLGVMIFLIPICIPMPPGIPMIVGAILGVFAVQLIIGRDKLWLPNGLAQKRLQRSSLRKAFEFAERYLGWLFRLARPRGLMITGSLGRRLSGVIFLILGFLLILPIPIIGNVLPALAGTVLALGLTDRDGLVFICGFIASLIAIMATVLMAIGTWSLLKFSF
jgi:hypothetical protein